MGKTVQITVGNITLSTPVFLAPMAGITDVPFRNMVAHYGAGLVTSEMVASQEVVQARPLARARALLGNALTPLRAFLPSESTASITPMTPPPTCVQLAGRDPYWMAEAARYVADEGADIIDINMGCPAKKVTNGYSGSALLRDLDHALRLIEAVVGAVSLPVTLKTRLGWNEDLINAPDLARRAEAAGVKLLTIHGRTRCQFYKGRADWNAIAAVGKAVQIPLIANGDIVTPQDALTALNQSGGNGVMIGRGAQGAPWRLAEISHALYGTPAPNIPQGAAFADMVIAHYEAQLSFYGTQLGLKTARKHLSWYLSTAGAERLRTQIMTCDIPAQVIALLRNGLSEATVTASVPATVTASVPTNALPPMPLSKSHAA